MNNRNYLSYIILSIVISVSVITFQFCTKKQTIEKSPPPGIINQDVLSESYRKTGWIEDGKYRTGVYILTIEEYSTSKNSEIDERIRLEAFKHLQKELNPTFNRNTSVQIKNLMDKYGTVIPGGKSCTDIKIYFFDIEKEDLRKDFLNIKNIR